MVAGRPKMGAFLVKRGIISEVELDAAIAHQVTRGCRLGEALVSLRLCSDAEVAQALAEQLEIPFVDLDQDPPSPACVALLPRELALEYGVLPVRMEGSRLLVAASDPYNIRIDDILRRATKLQPILATAPESQLQERLHQHYSESFFEESREEAPEPDAREQQLSVERLLAAGQEHSTVRVVNTLIADAVRRRASDLHVEPEENGIRVRYRIDGRMCPAVTLPGDLLQSIVARIKIMCGMDIAESRKPQDGGCRVSVDNRSIELRASTLCGVHGEITVLRLLCQEGALHQLDGIGFETRMLHDFRRLLAARNGVLLITGPTGSGKTTTLYAALNHLNREDVNIVTVEDPVEIKLPGINQVQIHDRAGRSFAGTLRSLVRQDPDIIMVGEIRDAETAEIASRAALTGHLVLSTLHTQHALGTVARLLDMGIAPWMVAACLNGVLAQRLVRRICESCALDYTPSPAVRRALESQFGSLDGARFRKGKGCAWCHGTGSRGRMGVFELLVVDEGLRNLLARGADSGDLRAHALKGGFTYMEQDAFRKACQGLIAPEEIIDLGFSVAMAMEELTTEPEQPAAPPPPAASAARPARKPRAPRRKDAEPGARG